MSDLKPLIEQVTVETIYLDGSRDIIQMNNNPGFAPAIRGEAVLSVEIGPVDVTTLGSDDPVAFPDERYKVTAEFAGGSVVHQHVAADGSTWTGPLDDDGRRTVRAEIARLRASGGERSQGTP